MLMNPKKRKLMLHPELHHPNPQDGLFTAMKKMELFMTRKNWMIKELRAG